MLLSLNCSNGECVVSCPAYEHSCFCIIEQALNAGGYASQVNTSAVIVMQEPSLSENALICARGI